MAALQQFWLVWREGSNSPTYKHDSYASAAKEAERLAEVGRGRQYWVMEAKAVCSIQTVTWEEAHLSGCNCRVCIPF